MVTAVIQGVRVAAVGDQFSSRQEVLADGAGAEGEAKDFVAGCDGYCPCGKEKVGGGGTFGVRDMNPDWIAGVVDAHSGTVPDVAVLPGLFCSRMLTASGSIPFADNNKSMIAESSSGLGWKR